MPKFQQLGYLHSLRKRIKFVISKPKLLSPEL